MCIAKLTKVSKTLKQKYLLSERAVRQINEIREMRKRGEKTLKQCGYYLNGSEIHIMTPEFLGQGAKLLGFKIGREDFDPDQYPLLFNNIVPNGKAFKKKEGESRRSEETCFEADLLFNRSISIEALLTNKEKQDAILEILRDANEYFIAEVERLCYAIVQIPLSAEDLAKNKRRKGKNRKRHKVETIHVPLKIAAASFTHVSSRPRKGEGNSLEGLEPHLHIHTQIFKHGVDEDGNVRNIQRDLLYKNQHILATKVDHYIINRFRNELGIEFDFNMAAENWYRSVEIAGYQKSGAIEGLSSGRAAILLAQAKRGGPAVSADEERRQQEIDNQNSRLGKIDLISPEDLDAYFHAAAANAGIDLIKLGQARDARSAAIRRQREWQAKNPLSVELPSDTPTDMLDADDVADSEAEGEKTPVDESNKVIKAENAELAVKRSRGIFTHTVDEALTLAIQDLSTRKLQIRDSDLVQKTMLYCGARFSVEDIEEAITVQIADKRLVSREVGTFDEKKKAAREITYVSKESVLREERLKRMWTALREDRSAGRTFTFGTPEMVQDAIACLEAQLSERAGSKQTLTLGQRAAAQLVVGRHGMVMIVGDAGTGKSTVCEVFTLINSRNKLGWRIVSMAPSGGAANSIAEAVLSKDPDAGLRGSNGAMTTQLAARNLAWWDKKVDAKTVIVIDEMGLIDIVDLEIIMKRAKERGALVVGVGDPKQFKSPTAGDGMAFLLEYEKDYCHVHNIDRSPRLAHLTQMSRAKTENNKKHHIGSRDDPRTTLLRMIRDEFVVPFADRSKRIDYLAGRFCDLSEKDRAHSYVVVTTNIDRVAINERIRSQLGLIGGYKVSAFNADRHTTQAKSMLSSYQVGDSIQVTNKLRLAEVVSYVKGQPRQKGEYHHVPKGGVLEIEKITDNGYVILKSGDNLYYFDPLVHGKNVVIGDRRSIAIARGEILRVGAKTKAQIVTDDGLEDFEITTGTRITCRRIDEATGKMQASLVVNGVDTRVWIDLNDPGISLRYGYCQTGHSMQGHTLSKDGTLLLDLSGLDHNGFYTDVTRSSWKDVDYVIDAAEPEALRRSLDRIGKSRLTDFGSRSNISVVAKRPCVIWPAKLDTKALAKLYAGTGAKAHERTVHDFMLLDDELTVGKNDTQMNEYFAEQLLAAQKRWGAVMLDGEVDGGLKRLADVVVALQKAGHHIVVAHDAHNTATKRLIEAAEKWAKTNPCVDLGRLNLVHTLAHIDAVRRGECIGGTFAQCDQTSKSMANVKNGWQRSNPHTSDSFDDEDERDHLVSGEDEADFSHLSPVRPSIPKPGDD